MNVLDRIKKGEFNSMSGEEQPDGTVIYTLDKQGDNNVYRARIRDLYGPNEELIWEETKCRE